MALLFNISTCQLCQLISHKTVSSMINLLWHTCMKILDIFHVQKLRSHALKSLSSRITKMFYENRYILDIIQALISMLEIEHRPQNAKSQRRTDRKLSFTEQRTHNPGKSNHSLFFCAFFRNHCAHRLHS